jgi:hypothetical protein
MNLSTSLTKAYSGRSGIVEERLNIFSNGLDVTTSSTNLAM